MMHAYSYTTLRYVHDSRTGEFVNCGVVLYAPSVQFLGAACRTHTGRIRKVFPGVDAASLQVVLRGVGRHFDKLSKKLLANSGFNFSSGKNALDFSRSYLVPDDSAWQWSKLGSGLTADPEKTLEELFERLVLRYDDHRSNDHRTDMDVWRDFNKELEQRNIANFFTAQTIVGRDAELEFKHAWKNGAWHCVEPLSFDLSTAEHIEDKATQWLGRLTAIRDTAESVKVYLLVGEPQDQKLHSAFGRAIKILKKAEHFEPEVISEQKLAELGDQLEDRVRSHLKYGLAE